MGHTTKSSFFQAEDQCKWGSPQPWHGARQGRDCITKMWWGVARVRTKLSWGFKSNLFWQGKGQDTASHLPLTNTPNTNRELVHSPGKSAQEHLPSYWAIEVMAFALDAVTRTATSGQKMPADPSSLTSALTQHNKECLSLVVQKEERTHWMQSQETLITVAGIFRV